MHERIELELNKGETQGTFSEITAHAEPDSVILRDLSKKSTLRILEQNCRADPVSRNLLLNHFEGQEIGFLSDTNVVRGKIIRSGYTPSTYRDPRPKEEPIIKVDGQLRFSLPGQPLFPTPLCTNEDETRK